MEVHLGVEKNFIPARKAHPAFIVDDLAGMIEKTIESGYNVTVDEPLEGCDAVMSTIRSATGSS